MSEGDNYVVWLNGNEYHRKHNKLHRDDGPAAIWSDGEQQWYKNGLLHRDDGPAIVDEEGKDYRYKEGKPYIPSAHDLMVYKMNEKERISHQ